MAWKHDLERFQILIGPPHPHMFTFASHTHRSMHICICMSTYHSHSGKGKKINSNSSLNTGRRHKTGEESTQIKYYPKKLRSLWPWSKCSSNLLYPQWSERAKSSPNRKTGSPGANLEPYWFSALTITKRIGPYWEDKSFHDSWISNLSQNKARQLSKTLWGAI